MSAKELGEKRAKKLPEQLHNQRYYEKDFKEKLNKRKKKN